MIDAGIVGGAVLVGIDVCFWTVVVGKNDDLGFRPAFSQTFAHRKKVAAIERRGNSRQVPLVLEQLPGADRCCNTFRDTDNRSRFISRDRPDELKAALFLATFQKVFSGWCTANKLGRTQLWLTRFNPVNGDDDKRSCRSSQ